MLLGVPLASTIYTLIKENVNSHYDKKAQRREKIRKILEQAELNRKAQDDAQVTLKNTQKSLLTNKSERKPDLNSPFKYSDDNKRYYTFNYYLRHRFGKKVFKVSLDMGCGCPNRDGTKGVGGCIYCSEKRSGDFAGNPAEDIALQFEKIRNMELKKWDDAYYIAYFQAGTNTYGDFDKIKTAFERLSALKMLSDFRLQQEQTALTKVCRPFL